MPDEVGAVLVVVADDRRDGVLVEGAHLLGVRGEHAEEQAVGAGADVLGDRRVGLAQDVEHELGLLDRAPELGRVGVEAREADRAVLAQALGQPARALERALGRVVAAHGGQQGVDAPVHVLGQRAGVVLGDGGHHVARAVGRELGAQHHGAARQVAAQAPCAPHDLARLEVGARAQVLEERAAQVLLDLLLGLLDRHLGERGDRREVQELARLGTGRRRADQHEDGADDVVAGHDRHLGADRRRHLRRAVLDAIGDVAAQRREVLLARRRRRHRRAEARDDDRHGRARRVGRQRRHLVEAVAAQDGVDHLEVNGAQPLDDASCAAARGGGLPFRSRRLGHAKPLFPRSWPRLPGGPGGPPRRTRRSGRGSSPPPAGRTPSRRPRRRSARA